MYVYFFVYTFHKYTYDTHILHSSESVALSFLSGKIFFKNLKYHSINQSFSVLRGHITFRYWDFSVRESDLNTETESTRKNGWGIMIIFSVFSFYSTIIWYAIQYLFSIIV